MTSYIEEPYNEKTCEHSLGSVGQYQSGFNMFWLDCFSASVKGVPIRASGVKALEEFFYPAGEDPGFFVGTLYAIAGQQPMKDVGSKIWAPSPLDWPHGTAVQRGPGVGVCRSRGQDHHRFGYSLIAGSPWCDPTGVRSWGRYEDLISQECIGKLEILSPEEQMHAPIFACARDILSGADEEHVKKWHTFFLTMTVCLLRVEEKDREVKAPFEATGRCCRCLVSSGTPEPIKNNRYGCSADSSRELELVGNRRETFGRLWAIGSPNRARAITPE